MPDMETWNRKTILLRWLKVVAGLIVASLGVHLTIFANIGLAPWDVLGMGVALHTPLNYGLSMTVMSVMILIIDLVMKEKVGVGTIMDALLFGNLVQAYNDMNPFPLNKSLPIGILVMLAGFLFMAIGIWIYMSAEQCCGPRDALLVGVGKRFPGVPIGFVEIGLWGTVTAVGAALGGPVGAGTLLSVLGAGLIMQSVYSVVHFDPRKLHHRDILQTLRMLTGPGGRVPLAHCTNAAISSGSGASTEMRSPEKG